MQSLEFSARSTIRVERAALDKWINRISVGLVIVACLVILGWVFNIALLKSLLPDLATMKPNTAFLFLLAGLVLWLNLNRKSAAYKRLTQIAACIIVLVGFLTLCQYLFRWNLGIDQLIYRSSSTPPVNLRMSISSASGFLLLGFSLILLLNTQRYALMQSLALLVISIGMIGFTGYMFSVSALYQISPFSSVALHSALAFCASGFGVLLSTSEQGFFKVIFRNNLGGFMARRLLPAVIVVPLVIGWLCLRGQYLGYYNTEFGLGLFAVSNIVIFTALIWWIARLLNHFDIEHQQAKHQLERYTRRMEILHKIDHGIIESEAIPDLINATIKELRLIIPCERIAINLFDHAKQELVTYAVDSVYTPLSVTQTPLLPFMLNGFDGGNTRIIDDLRLVEDQQLAQGFKVFLEKGLLSLFHVLLIQDGTIQGTLSLASSTAGFFTSEYHEIAVEVANQLAIATKEMRLSESLDFHLAELQTTKTSLQLSNDTLEARVMERTAQLNAAKEQVEAILNNSLDVILLTSLDLRIQQVNTSFAKLFAYRIGEHVDVSLLDLVQPEDAPRLQASVKNALSGTKNNTIEVRARRKDGSIFDAELSIGHIEGDGLVTTIHDITGRKVQERQLRYHAGIQSTVADAVIATDLEYRIQSWNNAAQRIYGWQADEVIGKPINDVLQTEFSSGQLKDELRRMFVENGHWTHEVTQRRRDGSPIDVLSSSVLFKDANQVPFGILTVNHDITERKQAEKALHKALEHEKELGDMKTRFISVASHEFRTPLSTILMTTESLTSYRDRMQPDQVDQKLDKVRQQVVHMTAIMEDVLRSAEMQGDYVDFKPTRDRLDVLCREIVGEFSDQPGFRDRIRYNCGNTMLISLFDARLMRQVITNLLSNALKYSADDKPVEIKLIQQASENVIQVIDQGIGIPEQDLKHIFEPFHRADNVGSVSGTGLGMNIAKKAVEMHEGTIEITSVLGQGTTVTVVIPTLPPLS